jgi:hypothetical protein
MGVNQATHVEHPSLSEVGARRGSYTASSCCFRLWIAFAEILQNAGSRLR